MNANNAPSPSEIPAGPDPEDKESVPPVKDPTGGLPDPPQAFPTKVVA